MDCFCQCDGYPAPALTVDALVVDGANLLLVKRGNDPFKGSWALPGGFVACGESTEDAVVREVLEETGITIELKGVFGVYSSPDRDPRGHVVTVCYEAEGKGEPEGASDATDARFFTHPEIEKLKLAFDHWDIIKDHKGHKR
jgi:8-oxo-dGTP diphosphatase